jgi:hypothetical protein
VNRTCELITIPYMLMKFQVLTAANLKVAAFWDVAPSSLVEVDRRFVDAYCLHHQGDERLHGVASCKSVSFAV